MEVETVYGDFWVKWLYKSTFGRKLSHLLCKTTLSKLCGLFQGSILSKNKISAFVEKFNINMQEFLPEEKGTAEAPYSSFNQFFIRRFRPSIRFFVKESTKMPAPCEGRYLGFEIITEDQTVPVKGKYLMAGAVLQKKEWQDFFDGGPIYIARLCPVDYHRFHYPDNGEVLDYYRVPGELHSVNPLALKYKADILSTNERQVTILQTQNFGKIAYIEVGAICVGKIVQTSGLKKFKRGEEKGYFLFGGSTVIVMGEKGKWTPSDDVRENSKRGIETYLHLGTEIAKKKLFENNSDNKKYSKS